MPNLKGTTVLSPLFPYGDVAIMTRTFGDIANWRQGDVTRLGDVKVGDIHTGDVQA